MTKTLILTGFEPFAGASLNPSQLLIEQVEKLKFADLEIVTEVLPVEYLGASFRLLDLINQHQPAAVIATGQAEGRSEISIERIAVNLANAKLADNSGRIKVNEQILQYGKDQLASTLPITEMVSAINQSGISAGESDSAGAFVCNYIFYQMQNILKTTSIPSGFIHLPLVTEQQSEFPDQPTMPLKDMVNGIAAAINALKNTL
ncbi:MAG: pyroglutamyl-peptidase I [Candidatus Nanopelagicales bacterium]